MSEKRKHQRQVIKMQSTGNSLSPTGSKILRSFEGLGSTEEQIMVFARLSRIVADAIEEDRIDHELIEKNRHEEADGTPWEEVRRELGLDKIRKSGKRR